MIEKLQDHGVGLGDMDAWLSGDVAKLQKDVGGCSRQEKD
jgi:hypothetical protein